MSPPATKLKKPPVIENLPAEMINELFKHLHPRDLASCSLVNKRWHSIYSHFKVRRLVVDDYYWSFEFRKWSYPDRRVEQKERCHMKMFCRLANQPLLSNLKYLALSGTHPQFDANVLNLFSWLMHLEIKRSLGKKNVSLNLSKLKALAVHPFNRNQLSIDCPELSLLVYTEFYNEYLLEVKLPETIRRLETNMVGPKLTRFKNVECLVISEFQVISKATLLSLPKLKELHYNAGMEKAFDDFNWVEDTLAKLKQALREFLDDGQVLRGSDFKVTFAGFQLTKTMLDQIDFGVQYERINRRFPLAKVNDYYIYMKNYQLLNSGALHFINRIYYRSLMENAQGKIPDCFSQKFSRVEWVYVGAVQDEAALLRFLKSLNWLRGISLGGAELSPGFYDELPASIEFGD